MVLVVAVGAALVLEVTALAQVVARLIVVEIRSNQRHVSKSAWAKHAMIGWFMLFAAFGLVLWPKFSILVTQNSPYTRLEADPHFVEAQVAFNNGEWIEAIDLYKKVLASTDDPNERLAIYYYLAAAKNSNGQHLEAIPLLKQVAAAKTLSNEIRAYAVQFMGIMTLNLIDPAAHSAIMAEIFKDVPYKEMYVAGDDSLSTRHVFEYASSLYPLGVSEANIARWYVGNILKNKISTTTEPGLSDLTLINKKLANADRDIERTKDAKQSSNLIPQIYARKAEVIEGLFQAGIISEEQVQKAYKKALESYSMYSTLTADDWFLRFRYAGFLAATPIQDRQKEIHSIVSPLYLDPMYTPLTMPFFETLGEVRLLQSPMMALEDDILKARNIGATDPDFKNFLISAGWAKSNF